MARLDEPGQCIPALQRVVHCFPQTIVGRRRMHGVVELGVEAGERRDHSLVSRADALLIGEDFDLPRDPVK